MATIRQPPPRSESYEKTYYPKEDSLRPRKHEHRNRSTSRTSPTKLYNADAPRRYIPNESRPRKPPFSPTIEDAGAGPDDVPMRGKPDQTPMLIQVAGDYSSTESNGPLTPDSSTLDGQDDNVRISEDDARHQEASNAKTARKTRPPLQPIQPRSDSRGRRQGLTVDTASARSVSTGDALPVCTERARSPYSYHRNPSRASKSRGSGSGDLLLSPEPLTPTGRDARKNTNFQPQPRPHPPRTHDIPSGGNTSGSGSGSHTTRDRPVRPQRPVIERRASAMPQLGSPTSASAASAARSRFVENSSDESDLEYAKLRTRSGQFTSDSLPSTSTSYFDTPRRSERNANPRDLDSPPRTPLSPEHTRATFLNRDSLLNGPGLQHLSALLEDHHSNPRRASPRSSPQPSPRPSPRGSPTASPQPSPPRTPPEPHHRRIYPVEQLRRDLPNSKPSSPLSSRPSSPKPAAQTFSARPMDPEGAQRTTPSKDRRTSTWDSAGSNKADPLLGPKIDIRAASPSVSGSERKPSHDSSDHERQPRHMYYVPSNGAPSLTAAPDRQRRRSSSTNEPRGGPPSLLTKPPVVHQSADTPKSPGSRKRSGSYVPAAAGATLGASLLEPASSSGRSRSTAPDSSSHQRHRSRSRAASDARPAPRSRSTAPLPFVPASDQKELITLPQCPRPDPVAGYSDWFALDRHPAMAICPDCKHNIFGTGFERAFQRRSEPQRSQKVYCSMNEPWTRMACLDAFAKKRKISSLLMDLGDLAEISTEEPVCPKHRLSEESIWYHLRDSETDRDFQDFQVCSHCVYSLEIICPNLGDIFHKSTDLKQEPRACSLRSDVHRLGKYLNQLVAMSEEAKKTGNKPPPTSDFIWEVKWMTVIDACKGDGVHYGQDMHKHPNLPELTICEECYYKNVRPVLKTMRREPRHFVHEITPEAKEVVGGASCKLYSPRMKQIFETACRERDFEYLQKAVRKRNDLQIDLEEAKMIYHRTPQDGKAKAEMDYLTEKWRKLERRHD